MPRVLVVADHASAAWGGEAVLPLHIFRGLRRAGCEAWLCVGDETRAELDVLLGPDRERVRYVHAGRRHALLKALEARTPRWFPRYLLFFARELLVQRAQASDVRALAIALKIDVVHQPTPVSPRIPSFLTHLPAPLVVGPLNGAMEYPRGFRFLQPPLKRALKGAARLSSLLVQLLARGKQQAALILVANARTARALPQARAGRVETMIENGVDPALWAADAPASALADSPLRLVFLGRLERWKGAEWLLRALALARGRFHLTIIGDFEDELARLRRLASTLGLPDAVHFAGYLPQAEAAAILKAADALVLPSVYECGGAVVLEAMAVGKPVVAAAWGGPLDYLTPETGILVPVTTPEGFAVDLAKALEQLAAIGAAGRRAMGDAGRERCLRMFAWPRKIEQLLAFYATVCRPR